MSLSVIKYLDCIGDFSLLGMPFLGHVVVKKSGHAFNHAFIKEFFANKNSWETCILNDSVASDLSSLIYPLVTEIPCHFIQYPLKI